MLIWNHLDLVHEGKKATCDIHMTYIPMANIKKTKKNKRKKYHANEFQESKMDKHQGVSQATS